MKKATNFFRATSQMTQHTQGLGFHVRDSETQAKRVNLSDAKNFHWIYSRAASSTASRSPENLFLLIQIDSFLGFCYIPPGVGSCDGHFRYICNPISSNAEDAFQEFTSSKSGFFAPDGFTLSISTGHLWWMFWKEGLNKEFARRLELGGKLGFLSGVQIAQRRAHSEKAAGGRNQGVGRRF